MKQGTAYRLTRKSGILDFFGSQKVKKMCSYTSQASKRRIRKTLKEGDKVEFSVEEGARTTSANGSLQKINCKNPIFE